MRELGGWRLTPRISAASKAYKPISIRLAVAILLSLLLLAWSSCWTLADILGDRAFSLIYEPEHAADEHASRQRALKLLSVASTLKPLDAQLWVFRYSLSNVRKPAGGGAPDAASDLRASTADFLIRALRLRPHWASLWVTFAEHELDQQAPGDDVLEKLRTASTFAPFTPHVLRAKLRIELTLWDQMEDMQRANTLATIRYLLEHDWKFVIDTAVSSHWVRNLRPLLTREEQVRHLEKALEGKAKSDAAEP